MKKRENRRLLALLLSVACAVGCLTGCTKESGNPGEEISLDVPDGVPTYEDDEYIELAAFCGPRRAGYVIWNESGPGHPDDPEEGWDTFITEKDFKDYMDAGFTYVMDEGDANYIPNFEGSECQKYMEIAEKLGIPVVVFSSHLSYMASTPDYRLTEDNKQFLDKMIEDLSQYKCFKGITVRDEPDASWAKTFKSIQDYIWSKNPDIYFFTCMLPIYGKVTSFSSAGGSDVEAAYKDYIRAFADATGTFAYDHYPLYIDPIRDLTSVKSDYYLNYELVARDAKEHGYPTGMVVQSSSWGPKGGEYASSHPRRTDKKADIAFQVYSALAYGAKYINYYTYWEHWSQGDNSYVYDSMVMYPEKNGQEAVKTDTYYAVQTVNKEISKFDHVFLKYDWQGSIAVVPVPDEMSAMLSCVKDYTSPRIKEVKSTDETLIGCMKDEKGYDGFWIVNATDPGKNLSNSVTITFKEATSAICYIEGEETKIELKDGSYTFDLEAGEGVFVIPVK